MIRVLLTTALLLVATSARADWREASTAHFVVYSQQPADRLKRFATQLEQFDKAVRFLLHDPDKPIGKANRVTVYMVDDLQDVTTLAGNDGIAGFYRPRAGGSLAVVPRRAGPKTKTSLDPQTVLLHEYTHHLMWTLHPDAVYPAWYVEGFAEMLATTVFEDDGAVSIGKPPLYRAYSIIAGTLSLDKLLSADSRRLSNMEVDGLYGIGWLLTHYLSFGKTREGQLTAYLGAINSGKTPQQAAAVFGDLKALERELDRYKMGRITMMRIAAQALPIGEIAIRTLTPGEAATMDVRIRSKNGVTAKTAPPIYAAAKRAAADYPNDPGAQIVLAETAFDAGDFATAEAAADRALAADPRAIDALVYKAKAQMAAAERSRDRTKERWAVLRKAILAANRLDPKDPEPLILYYQSFLAAGEAPTSNAKDGLYEAFTLAPQDDTLRFNTAAMFLSEGELRSARSLLAPLAYQPHANGMTRRAIAAIAKIDAGDRAGAMAELSAA